MKKTITQPRPEDGKKVHKGIRAQGRSEKGEEREK